MEQLTTDILVIGSGLAGLLAAFKAEEAGLRVLIVGKFTIGMGTNTSLAHGTFTAPNSRFSKEAILQATLASGKGLNRRKLVSTLIENSPEAIKKLKDYGVPVIEKGMGYEVDRPQNSSQLSGTLMVKPLVERLRKSTITVLSGLVIFDLVVAEGEVRGAFGFLRDGKTCLIRSGAVILATGGAGALYGRNDNQRSILGDGYFLALRAGLSLVDLEFIQCHPFVLREPRLSTFCLSPPYPEEVKLFNERKEDLLEKAGMKGDLNQVLFDQGDLLTRALYYRSETEDVFFDLTRVPQEKWEQYPLNFLKKTKFPFHQRPFLVSPAVHFFMGGVEIDETGKTSLPGLFAAGEVAGGIHGANRLKGNALMECLTFGLIGGQSAAESVLLKKRNQDSLPFFPEDLIKKWERKIQNYLRKKRGTFDPPKDLIKDLKELAWKCAGPVREDGSLREGMDRLAFFEEKIERIYPTTVKDLFKKRDLENMTLLLNAIFQGSMLRTESRGSFFRKDFPDQDDTHWLKNTCYRMEGEKLQVSHRSVQD